MSSSTAITIGFLAVYFAVSLRMLRGLRLDTRSLCVCGIIIALTLILDSVRIPLPTGATISLCSPVPLMLLAILLDKRLAILSGWVCGLLALFLIPVWYPVHWGQVFAEHLVCFSALGYAGIFGSDRRWKILLGILTASLLKLTGHLLSGVLFFSQNAWDGWGAWGYSLAYNISQNVPLCLLCGALILALPLQAMKRAIRKEPLQ